MLVSVLHTRFDQPLDNFIDNLIEKIFHAKYRYLRPMLVSILYTMFNKLLDKFFDNLIDKIFTAIYRYIAQGAFWR
jgi:hypothetical protein